jgi:hypothetical protein
MIKSEENAVTGGIKRNISYCFKGRKPKRGMVFFPGQGSVGVKRKNPLVSSGVFQRT